MDEVNSYLVQTRKASMKLFHSSDMTLNNRTQPVMQPSISNVPRLPPKPKRRRSPPGDSSETSATVAPNIACEPPKTQTAMSRLLQLMTPTIQRQHLPHETFVKATSERFNILRERILTMRMAVRERHGDRMELLKDRETCLKMLLQTQHGGGKPNRDFNSNVNNAHYFSLPLTKALGAWFKFLEHHGPLEPVLCSHRSDLFSSIGNGGQPAMTMLTLASDGDLNNLFGAVLTKVVRGAKEGRYELKKIPSTKKIDNEADEQSDGGEAASNNDAELANIAWLYHSPPHWARPKQESVFESLGGDIKMFVQSLITTKVMVGTSEVVCRGYGAWTYTALAAVELPLDPVSERLLQQLYQLVCRSISAIRSQSEGYFPATRIEEVEEALCCLDTLLVILCRQFHLNNSDLVPL